MMLTVTTGKIKHIIMFDYWGYLGKKKWWSSKLQMDEHSYGQKIHAWVL